NPEETSPSSLTRLIIPKVPLTKKSKHKENLMLSRRKILTHEQGIRIVGNGAEGPPRLPSPVEDGLCTRFQQNEAATQTLPVYCFSTVSEMMTFLNGDKSEEQSLEDTSQDSDPGEATSSSDNHTPKLEIDEDDDEQPAVAHLYPQPTALYSPTSSPQLHVVKRRRKQRFHCDWEGAITFISSPNVPSNATELRVDKDLAMSIRRQVDINNPGPFGWQLAKLLFMEEELYGHNFNGTDHKMPLSPRRVHAIQHAFHDYFPRDMAEEALAKGRTAINQGIRNMFYVRNRRDPDITLI
ncbi:uncharacterized protein, partial [Engystomops pustulosus]|uniref:uncharacterized protein n=1 Tax=Engystomops pustulosus TaxID=76066 RepID=UPI003AFB3C50